MIFDQTSILAIISLASLLFNILQQQKIKSMKFTISNLEDEIEDKTMIIRALTEHVEHEGDSENSDNDETKIDLEIESDAQPVHDNLTREDVFNYIIQNNMTPTDKQQFTVAWYFPSKYAVENIPPDLTAEPWVKIFTFNLENK